MGKLNIFFWPLVILCIFFIISFFLSLSETAFIALSRIRLRQLVNKGLRNAKVAEKVASRLDRLITTILIGNNFANIGISVIGGAIFIYFFGQKWGMLISTLVISFFILVFLEITPKIFATQYPEKVSLLVARPINLLVYILRPIANVFMGMGKFLIRLFGGQPKRRAPLITEEEIKLMIEVGKEEGAVSDEERWLLHRIFEFGDIEVGDVMVPKDKIVAVGIDTSSEGLLNTVVEEGHSRIPVYKDSINNIIGVIYARDLLHIWRNKGLIIIPDLVQPAYFVQRGTKVNEVLRTLQRMKIQIAIVVDEDKKTQGLVTLEDLIEEIVGEIDEEYR